MNKLSQLVRERDLEVEALKMRNDDLVTLVQKADRLQQTDNQVSDWTSQELERIMFHGSLFGPYLERLMGVKYCGFDPERPVQIFHRFFVFITFKSASSFSINNKF